MKNFLGLPLTLTATLVPLVATAQTPAVNLAPIQSYSGAIITVINFYLVPVLMAIAFIVFLWGVYKYFILGAADEQSRTDGRQFTLWGVIGFVVILSLWGLVNLVMGTLGLSVGQAPPFPTIGGSLPVGGSAGQPGVGNPSVTTQAQATTAYQNCMAGGGSGATCQAVYNQVLGVPTGQTGTTQSTASQGQGCTGENTNSAGTCEPQSSCIPANTDTSATCATGGFICCEFNSGGTQTGGGVGQECETQGCESGLECVLGGDGTHICAEPAP